jgi:choline dehydrogenase
MGQDPSALPSLVTGDLNNNSPNRDQQVGISGFPTHQSPLGVRVSARNPVMAVLNATNADGSKKYPLTLSLQSFVTKVLFNTTEGKKPKATGVEYLLGQSMFAADPRYSPNTAFILSRAYARKEVIISGGTFNTPLILKHSGIGPSTELQKFNITVLVDLPGVGANLQDNYEMGIAATASVNFTNLAPACTFGAPGDPCLALWENGTGPYTLGLLDSLMFKSSDAVYGERDLFMWGGTGAFKGFWPGDTVNVIPNDPPSTFAFNIAKIHSRSRLGTVALRSADPRDVPDINFRFFEDEDGEKDIEAMAEGIEFGRSVYRALSNSSIGPFQESMPCVGTFGGCDTKAFVREQAWSHHASSSCPIGADGDEMAVLDSRFRVRGTEGLRVVDASVFPRGPGGFPVLPTFVVSEKAVEVLLEDA